MRNIKHLKIFKLEKITIKKGREWDQRISYDTSGEGARTRVTSPTMIVVDQTKDARKDGIFCSKTATYSQ